MTIDEIKALGYEVVRASDHEVGLIKNGVGLRTWFCQVFDHKLPPLDHPILVRYIQMLESFI